MVLVPRRSDAARHDRASSRILRRKKKPYKIVFEDVKQEKKKLRSAVSYSANAPAGYDFVPVGLPDLSEKCKELCRRKGLVVHLVSATPKNKASTDPDKISHYVHRIGYHFPNEVVDLACDWLGYTFRNGTFKKDVDTVTTSRLAKSLARHKNKRKNADQESKEQITAAIRDLFPKIPNQDLDEIVKHAFRQGTGRVGNAGELPLPRRVQLAVVAHIRHGYTEYDQLLKTGSYLDARARVEQPCLDKLMEWRGENDDGQTETEEAYREFIVIDSDSDDDEESSDEGSITSAERAPSMEIFSSRAQDQDLQPQDYAPMQYAPDPRGLRSRRRIIVQAPAHLPSSYVLRHPQQQQAQYVRHLHDPQTQGLVAVRREPDYHESRMYVGEPGRRRVIVQRDPIPQHQYVLDEQLVRTTDIHSHDYPVQPRQLHRSSGTILASGPAMRASPNHPTLRRVYQERPTAAFSKEVYYVEDPMRHDRDLPPPAAYRHRTQPPTQLPSTAKSSRRPGDDIAKPQVQEQDRPVPSIEEDDAIPESSNPRPGMYDHARDLGHSHFMQHDARPVIRRHVLTRDDRDAEYLNQAGPRIVRRQVYAEDEPTFERRRVAPLFEERPRVMHSPEQPLRTVYVPAETQSQHAYGLPQTRGAPFGYERIRLHDGSYPGEESRFIARERPIHATDRHVMPVHSNSSLVKPGSAHLDHEDFTPAQPQRARRIVLEQDDMLAEPEEVYEINSRSRARQPLQRRVSDDQNAHQALPVQSRVVRHGHDTVSNRPVPGRFEPYNHTRKRSTQDDPVAQPLERTQRNPIEMPKPSPPKLRAKPPKGPSKRHPRVDGDANDARPSHAHHSRPRPKIVDYDAPPPSRGAATEQHAGKWGEPTTTIADSLADNY